MHHYSCWRYVNNITSIKQGQQGKRELLVMVSAEVWITNTSEFRWLFCPLTETQKREIERLKEKVNLPPWLDLFFSFSLHLSSRGQTGGVTGEDFFEKLELYSAFSLGWFCRQLYKFIFREDTMMISVIRNGSMRCLWGFFSYVMIKSGFQEISLYITWIMITFQKQEVTNQKDTTQGSFTLLIYIIK